MTLNAGSAVPRFYPPRSLTGAMTYFVGLTSVANLGSPTWTPGGDNACSGKGYSALVCPPGGWNRGVDGTLSPAPFDPSLPPNKTRGINVYSYDCGKAPSWVPRQDPALVQRSVITGEVRYACASQVLVCHCFPGFAGDDCSRYLGPFSPADFAAVNASRAAGKNLTLAEPLPLDRASVAAAINSTLVAAAAAGRLSPNYTAANLMKNAPAWDVAQARAAALAATNIFPPSLGISGFCVPVVPAYVLDDPVAATAAADQNKLTRTPGVCSGRGYCLERANPADPQKLAFGGCFCDDTFYGPQCEFTTSSSDSIGDFGNDALGLAPIEAARCVPGAIPWQNRNYRIFSFPNVSCNLHGFGLRYKTLPDGRLTHSNVFRTHTAGVCFCEPSFAGEECLGGPPVAEGTGTYLVVQTFVFLFLVSRMYQHRRAMQKYYERLAINPEDFTVFAVLPGEFNAKKNAGLDLARVRLHFSQWGPVHCVTPALDDDDALQLKIEQWRVMKLLHVKLEEAAYKRRWKLHKDEERRKKAQKRADKAARKAARAMGAVIAEPDPRFERDAEVDAIMAEPDWEEHDAEEREKAAKEGRKLPPPFDLRTPRPGWYTLLQPEVAERSVEKPIIATRPYALPAVDVDTLYELEYTGGASGESATTTASATSSALVASTSASAAGSSASGAPAAAAAAAANKGRRVFPVVDIWKHTRVLIKLPGTASLFNTRFLRAYGRWLESKIDDERKKLENCVFENAFVTFVYSRDAVDCMLTYELYEIFESKSKADPTLKQVRQAQGLSEGEVFFESRRTGKRKLVNVLLQKTGIDKVRKQLAPHMPAAVRASDAMRQREMGSSGTAAALQREEATVAPLRGVERDELEVSGAMAPADVRWSSMDSTPFDQMRLAVAFVCYQIVISFVLFEIVYQANASPAISKSVISNIIVILTNQLGARQWNWVIALEENYSAGGELRSVYFKTLGVQLAISLLSATLATYGLPMDPKNGYISDFYANAGTFLSTGMLIDAALDVVLSHLAIPRRIKTFQAMRAKSRLEWYDKNTPAAYQLQFKTAGTMRAIFLICAFSSGCPALLMSGSIALLIKYWVESKLLFHDLQLMNSGPELARALDYTMLIAVLIFGAMGWSMCMTMNNTEPATMYGFFLACALSLWAMMGYVSWKSLEVKEAFFGFGVLPGVCYLPVSVQSLVKPPLEWIHVAYMHFVFGDQFFVLAASSNYDGTQGKHFVDIVRHDQALLGEAGAGIGMKAEMQWINTHYSMRMVPYFSKHRNEVFPEYGSTEPLQPTWTAAQMFEFALRDKKNDRIYFRKAAKAKAWGRPVPPMPRSIAMDIAVKTGGGVTSFYPRTASEAVGEIESAYGGAVGDVVEELRNEFFYMDKDKDGLLSAADAKAARVPQAVFLAILNAVGLTESGSLDPDTFVLLKLQAGVGGRVPMEVRQETAQLMVELQGVKAFSTLHTGRMNSNDMRTALRQAGLGDAGLKDEAAAQVRLDRYDQDGDGLIELSEFVQLLMAERGVSPSPTLASRRSRGGAKRIRALFNVLSKSQRTVMLKDAMYEAIQEKPVEPTVFGFLTRQHPLRAAVISFVRSALFENLTAFAVITNAAIMGCYDPTDPNNLTLRNQIVDISEPVFSAIYTAEAAAKLICFGPSWRGNGYFASPWNCFDFSLIFLLVFQFLGKSGSKASGLRVFRMMRLLQTAYNEIVECRVILDAVYGSLPGLFNVLLLMLGADYTFGLIGVMLWRGANSGNCAWSDPLFDPNLYDPNFNPEGPRCGPNGTTPDGVKVPFVSCLPFSTDPNSSFVQMGGQLGATRVIGSAFLDTVQYCALLCDPAAEAYGACTPSFGAQCLAQPLPISQQGGGFLIQTVSTACVRGSAPDWGVSQWDNVLYGTLVSFIATTMEGWSSVMYSVWNSFGAKPLTFFLFFCLITFGTFFAWEVNLAIMWESYEASAEKETNRESIILDMIVKRLVRDESIASGVEPPPECGERIRDVLPDGRRMSAVLSIEVIHAHLHDAVMKKEQLEREREAEAELEEAEAEEAKTGQSADEARKKLTKAISKSIKPQPRTSGEEKEAPPPSILFWLYVLYVKYVPPPPAKISLVFRRLAMWPPFDKFFVALVILNTVTLGMAYHSMTDEYGNGLEILSSVLMGFFCLEAFVKIVALGFRGFLNDPFNAFDGFVISTGLIEIVVKTTVADAGNTGLSSLRVLRIFRLLRLARQFPTLQRLMIGLANGISASIYAILLLVLIIFMFAVYGMQSFGEGYSDPDLQAKWGPTPYLNFSSLFWAFVTVYDVMDKQNWDRVIKYHMAAFGWYYSIFFVIIVIVGYAIFLNLFIAILMSVIDAANVEGEKADKAAAKAEALSLKAKGPGYLAPAQPKSFPARLLERIKLRVARIRRQKQVAAACEFCMGRDEISSQVDESAHGPRRDAHQSMMSPKERRELLTKELGDDPEALAAALLHEALGDEKARGGLTFLADADWNVTQVEIMLPVYSINTKRANRIGAVLDMPENFHLARSVRVTIDADGKWLVEGSSRDPNVMSVEGRAALNEIEAEAKKTSFLAKIIGGGKVKKSKMSAKVAPAPIEGHGAGRDGGGQGLPGGGIDGYAPRTWQEYLGVPSIEELEADPSIPGRACLPWCSKRSTIRRALIYNFNSNAYKWLGFLVSVVSTINCAVHEPRVDVCGSVPDSQGGCASLLDYLTNSDVFFTIFFPLDYVQTSVVQGVFATADSSMRNPWSLLDLFVVIVSLLQYITPPGNGYGPRILSGLNSVRVIRLASRVPALRLIVSSLTVSIGRARDTSIVLFLIMYVFAVVGLQLFMGGQFSCSDSGLPNPDQYSCTGNFTAIGDACLYAPSWEEEIACRNSPDGSYTLQRAWLVGGDRKHLWGFNNIFGSFLNVFELVSGENWPVMMQAGTDFAGNNKSPQTKAFPAAALYFILAEVLLNQMLIELVTGVVVDTFLDLRSKANGVQLLTRDQQIWVRNVRLLLSKRPARMEQPTGQGTFARNLFWLATNRATDTFVTAVICFNLAVMGMVHFGQDPFYDDFTEQANLAFTIFFAAEALLKIAGCGLRQYLLSAWNRLDFALVGLGVASVCISGTGLAASTLRLLRVARIVRLVRFSRGASRLLGAFVSCLPSFLNIMMALFAFIFVYAVMGMAMFSGMRRGIFGYSDPVDVNFDTFFVSVTTLFRFVTGENFNGVMREYLVQPPFCIAPVENGPAFQEYTCASPAIAIIFFVSYFSIANFIISSLMTAAAIEAYYESSSKDLKLDIDEDDDEGAEGAEEEVIDPVTGKSVSSRLTVVRLTKAALAQYADLWGERDTLGTQFLPKEAVQEIIAGLQFPFGLDGDERIERATRDTVAERIEDENAKIKAEEEARLKAEEDELAKNVSNLKAKAKALRGKPGASGAASLAAAANEELIKWRAANRKDTKDADSEQEVKKLTPAELLAQAAAEEAKAAQREKDRHAEKTRRQAMENELRKHLKAIQARNVFDALPLVASKFGLFHFHAVLHALIERASGGAPLGVHVGSLHIIGQRDEHSTRSSISLRHLQLLRRVQCAWRKKLYTRQLAAAKRAVSLLDGAVKKGGDRGGDGEDNESEASETTGTRSGSSFSEGGSDRSDSEEEEDEDEEAEAANDDANRDPQPAIPSTNPSSKESSKPSTPPDDLSVSRGSIASERKETGHFAATHSAGRAAASGSPNDSSDDSDGSAAESSEGEEDESNGK